MITLANVRDWVKTLNTGAEFYYSGKLSSKKEKSIGIYQPQTRPPAHVCLGGIDNNFYDIKPVSLLVHWNNNSTQTESAALTVYQAIQSAENITIGGNHVCFIQMGGNEPVDVSTDENGIYERVIEFNIYFERT